MQFSFLESAIGAVHKLRKQARGEGGLAKCLCYYISLCSKLAYGGGRGGQKLAKSCLRSLWMPPKNKYFSQIQTNSLPDKIVLMT